MKDILSFWASKGVDGFRCDMAEMVPSEFWNWCIGKIKAEHPDIVFIGEVYNPSLYRSYLGSGFDYLYDKVGMYDCLCRIIKGESSASDITYQWQVVDDIKDHMLYFLETMMNYASQAIICLVMLLRLCLLSLLALCYTKIRSCFMPDKSLANAEWTRKASADRMDAPLYLIIGRLSLFIMDM